jgi:uncharacterized protein with ParB-like and HNH nuclease domain
MSNLDQQVEEKRKEIHTDAYPMSIGEIINLYTEGDLDIHPEFQRIFRWNQIQKSRLIESILLGIPLPSFFVAQRDDGVWDVVDGLQRLSTIFSFLGIYKNENDEVVTPLQLTGTEYLPSLEGKYWSEELNENHISKELQRAFKREKIDLKIVKKESDEQTKYELFQRLNTFGSSLSDQEVRNCLLIMINKPMYEWISGLAQDEHFKNVFPLTGKQIDEQYNMELILRFLSLKDISIDRVRGGIDIGEFLTKRMKEIAIDENYDMDVEGQRLMKTFKILDVSLGENAFKKYQNGRFLGAFSLSIFEVIGLGLGYNIDSYDDENQTHLERIQLVSSQLLDNPEFIRNSGSGARASTRLPHILPMGRDLLSL